MLGTMRQQLEEGLLTSESANELAEELSLHLAALRNAGDISNDAFLEAGVIQGGVSVLATMIDSGSNNEELSSHLAQLSDRGTRICESYPELADFLA